MGRKSGAAGRASASFRRLSCSWVGAEAERIVGGDLARLEAMVKEHCAEPAGNDALGGDGGAAPASGGGRADAAARAAWGGASHGGGGTGGRRGHGGRWRTGCGPRRACRYERGAGTRRTGPRPMSRQVKKTYITNLLL